MHQLVSVFFSPHDEIDYKIALILCLFFFGFCVFFIISAQKSQHQYQIINHNKSIIIWLLFGSTSALCNTLTTLKIILPQNWLGITSSLLHFRFIQNSIILCHYKYSHTFPHILQANKMFKKQWEGGLKDVLFKICLLCAITPNHTYVSQSCRVCVSDVDYNVPITSVQPALTLWSASNLHSCLVISIAPLW